MSTKWKYLIISMLIFQIGLTVTMYSLVDTASYFARTSCEADWCGSRVFGYILTNQGAWDTSTRFLVFTAILVIFNGIIWGADILQKRTSPKTQDGEGGDA